MIHRSPLPDVEIPDVPLTSYVLESAAALGDRPALIDGTTGRAISYAQLLHDVRSLTAGLASIGLGRGDVLALASPNLPEYAVVLHAVAALGAVITTVNPAYTEREMHHQLVDSGAVVLVAAGPSAAVALAAAEGTAVRTRYVIGPDPLPAPGADGVRPLAMLLGEALADPVPVGPDDVVALPYSSGTTGGSKGVMLTHRNLIANLAQSLAHAGMQGDDEVVVAVLPFFHIYGLQVVLNCGLRSGATIVTLPRFDLAQYLQVHQTYRVTRSFVAPPIVLALARHPLVDSYDLSALRRMSSGAAPLTAGLAHEASARLGCEVVQGYGMTELSPVSHLTPEGGFVPGSVGVATPNMQVRVVDPGTGADVEDGVDGEVWIRGPQVMRGYLNNPAATALTLDDEGWLHTGDIGHMGPDEHLFIVDRLKELIKVSGFQVAPAELEGLLLTHPLVADAAVVGAPDDRTGEVPVAYVVLRQGPSGTGGAMDLQAATDDVLAFVAERVARFKRPREIHVVDAIPKSAAGKILRRLLKEQSVTG
jgi:acyl-CoA synthetase (AMP-forming)/AMP-acid ligase II